MAVLLDEDFQSYSVGATPPFANLSGGGVIENTNGGPYGDAKSLQLGASQSVIYPILPNITLTQAQAGVTYENSGVPTYNQATVWQALFINYYPQMNGDILIFHSDLNPFAGNAVVGVRILPDGTVAITAPRSSAFSNNQAISTYALYPGKWYFFQTNVSFSVDTGYMAVNIRVAVNGVEIVASSWTTTQLNSGLPVLYFNNVEFGSCANGTFAGRFTINDTVQTMPSFPHAGSPKARVSQGIIEIAKFVASSAPLGASCPLSSAAQGIPYSQSISVTGGVTPLTYAVTSGALPTGLSLDTSTGLISGTPTVVGSYSYQITVTDNISATYVINCNILVPPTPSRPAKFCQSFF